MAESAGLLIGLFFTVLSLSFPLISWAMGRWYQGRLFEALDANEKAHGTVLQSDRFTSTTMKMDNMAATSATLLHISICVGPSVGQVVLMWFKGLFGGRLQSYDAVLDYGRREALYRLKQQADQLGCTSMQNIRLETSVVSFAKNNNDSRRSSVEFLAFATGIRQ
ncbi:MAG: heavy metal-binding domain-containing protein [Candidatus Thermoplasmatota archaeon]|nr:heavy metal-binding domain-containing protein [Candidatus Thermoplasmatota archaeon]